MDRRDKTDMKVEKRIIEEYDMQITKDRAKRHEMFETALRIAQSLNNEQDACLELEQELTEQIDRIYAHEFLSQKLTKDNQPKKMSKARRALLQRLENTQQELADINRTLGALANDIAHTFGKIPVYL